MSLGTRKLPNEERGNNLRQLGYISNTHRAYGIAINKKKLTASLYKR